MRYNKKISLVFLGLLMLSVLVISFASAAEEGFVNANAAGYGAEVSNGINALVDTLSPVTSWIFGSDKSTGDAGFVALMAFLLTLLVIMGVLSPMKIFGEKQAINWAIATIVALIGVRFVPVNMLTAFTIPAEGLVGALFLLVPFFVVGSLILKIQSTGIRKFSWIAYAVIIATLWAKAFSSSTGWTKFYWIYVIILVLCLIAFFMDGTIQRFFRKGEAAKTLESVNNRELDRIQARISDLETALASATTDAQRTRIEAQIDIQKKNLKALIK